MKWISVILHVAWQSFHDEMVELYRLRVPAGAATRRRELEVEDDVLSSIEPDEPRLRHAAGNCIVHEDRFVASLVCTRANDRKDALVVVEPLHLVRDRKSV